MSEIETARMSNRGQIIIPIEIRKHINAEDNTLFTLYPLDKDTIIMKKFDSSAMLNEFRRIHASIKNKMTTEEINEEIHAARGELRKAKSRS
ncbi:MAG: AbrB/MazE/SpoVT family DNA-binding domain-containing protein [Nanoarchaeota archaeon]